MDKKLLVDFSKIIREIESKNLFKEADTLNNCLVRLSQISESANPSETKNAPEAIMPDLYENKEYSIEFITEFNDFSNKTTDFTKKAADIVTTGRKIDSMELEELNKIIEQANKLISINEAQGEELDIIRKTLDQFTSFKNKIINN